MKTRIISLLIFSFLITACCSVSPIVEVNDDFLMDIASENYRLGGEMYLDEFEEDLSSLSYAYYINYLTQHQAPSAEELSNKIKSADEYYFGSKVDGFFITLLYKSQNTIVGDDSRTALVDTVFNLQGQSTIPGLENIAEQFGF
jgi:hypothetical protein